MPSIFNNFAYSTLAAAITTAGQTSVTVQTGHGDRFPVVASPDVAYVTLKNSSGTREIICITTRAVGSDVLTVTRGAEGTTATTWAIGDVIQHDVTAGYLNKSALAAEHLTSVAGTNTITAVGSVKLTAYNTGQVFTFIAANTITGAATLNVTAGTGGSALGAKNIYKGTSAVSYHDIVAGEAVTVVYDGTQFQLISTGVSFSGSLLTSQQALKCYILPSMADGWRGIYRAGFDWWSRNQQWGGPFGFMGLLDGAAGNVYNGEAATGYADVNSVAAVNDDAARSYVAQGFKVPETQTISAVWVKLYKVLAPNTNLGAYIYSDTGGVPNALIADGTATAQSQKLHTSDTNGQWYRFVFPTPPSCTGGTQYHLVLKSDGAVNASNYWGWMYNTAKKYPFGNYCKGDATPNWTATTTAALAFLVELSATAQTLQADGQFDGKLVFGGSGASGTLSMSRGLANMVPLRELMDPTESTGYLVGTALTKDATIFDSGYGEDHDRIVVRSNVTTGYGQIDVYESDGTKVTVTATATDLSSGAHSVGWYVRAQNDGADRVDLFIDGTTYSSATNLSISFDKNFANLGTMYLGGGFAVAPTWTGNAMTDTAQLPSHANNGSWTWGGTGTEANCMSMQGGKLRQNKNGYASTDTGYYAKTMTFSNANGYEVAAKFQVLSSPNSFGENMTALYAYDGAKRNFYEFAEYWNRESSVAGFQVQVDYKASEQVVRLVGKGSDQFLIQNRKLLVDGSGNLTSASATNATHFGDFAATAGANADAVYSYVKYYNTAWNPPQFTTGSISEFAIWQGNLKALWPLLYNGGTFVSVKTLLGVPENYLDKSVKIPAIVQRGITSAPTSTDTAVPPTTGVPEMEAFVVGERIDAEGVFGLSGGAGNGYVVSRIDGAITDGEIVTVLSPVAGFYTAPIKCSVSTFLGLHKVISAFGLSSGTMTAAGQRRLLRVESKL